MQALILAAGMGTRLSQYTKSVPKCMVPVNSKTMIESSVEALIDAGIKTLVIGLGYKGDVLKSFIEKTFPSERLNGMKIEYAENPVYDKTNNIYSLYLAKDFFMRDDTILLESDLVYDKTIIKQLIENSAPNIAVVSHFESWMDGTCTLIDSENNITELVGKSHFNWKETDKYYKTVNIYKFSKEFINNYYLPFLESYQKVYGKNEYYETVLGVLSFLTPGLLKALPVSGDLWHEIDDPADLNIAENKFCGIEKKYDMMMERGGGVWRFPGLIDFTDTSNSFFPPKKLLDELSVNFDSYILCKPSFHSQQSILASKLFQVLPEHIIAGNGSALLLHGSVVLPEFVKQFDYISNPSTEDGTLMTKDIILEKCNAALKQGKHLVVNETYCVFSDKEKYFTLLDEETLSAHKNLLVVRSLSEEFGLPGLNLAVAACADVSYLNQLKAALPEENITSIAEYFMQIVEKYKKQYEVSFALTAQERQRMEMELSSIQKLCVHKSQSNLVICTVNDEKCAESICRTILHDKNILVSLNGKRTFRIAVQKPDENSLLIKTLNTLLRL
jgi:choline kinase